MSIETEGAGLRNPGLPGELQFDTFIYGSPPLPYPPVLNQYAIYNAPDPAYVTGRINVSAFANLGGATPWPFANTNVPLNGHVCIPRGRGRRRRGWGPRISNAALRPEHDYLATK